MGYMSKRNEIFETIETTSVGRVPVIQFKDFQKYLPDDLKLDEMIYSASEPSDCYVKFSSELQRTTVLKAIYKYYADKTIKVYRESSTATERFENWMDGHNIKGETFMRIRHNRGHFIIKDKVRNYHLTMINKFRNYKEEKKNTVILYNN